MPTLGINKFFFSYCVVKLHQKLKTCTIFFYKSKPPPSPSPNTHTLQHLQVIKHNVYLTRITQSKHRKKSPHISRRETKHTNNTYY